jgi:REP element-mobilizing transposase RayT
MPRPSRCELAGGIHHVTARGNNGADVFADTLDRHVFLRLFAKALARFEWRCLTYCLMRNHYHLLLLTEAPTLGAGVGYVNGRYAQAFNARHSRSGHLWGQRYHAVLVERGAHLLEAMRYIALNPVRAGFCDRAEDWPWGGHRALAGLGPAGLVDLETTWSYLAADGGNGRHRYRDLVAQPKEGLAPFRVAGRLDSPANAEP